jgi:enoyl-CoA hydratase/long-chain 3-hydroxyacyl-CoA dehydrogenase
MVKKNTNGMYPAPYAIMDCVSTVSNTLRAMINSSIEREELPNSPRLKSPTPDWYFDGMTSMKKAFFWQGRGDSRQDGRRHGEPDSWELELPGPGRKGFNVLLKDRNDEAVGRGLSYMGDN